MLAPANRVCQALNAELQAALNPPRGQAERPHGALPLRAGDRVIQTRNHYGLGVFNGDTGTVTAVAAGRGGGGLRRRPGGAPTPRPTCSTWSTPTA